ncbi:MAG: lysophospholipid acyltransferase family protein [Thermodesulfobacteria bacterium]|nr:lysophospholipid acyltransferase family protein [Thermodesulfobacteriota bacterium]
MIRKKAELLVLKTLLKFIELWLSSCRLTLDGHPDSLKLFRDGRQVIGALWHSSLIYCLYHFRNHPAAIMVSPSSDGEWVARALRLWGQYPVRGSRLKGGLAAIRQLTEVLKKERLNAGIVADGSQGPACVAQKGAVVLARDTGLPIIPLGVAARPAYHFSSWDRLMLPLPFSSVVMFYGQPIYVAPGTRGQQLEKERIRLERALNQSTQRARDILDSK